MYMRAPKFTRFDDQTSAVKRNVICVHGHTACVMIVFPISFFFVFFIIVTMKWLILCDTTSVVLKEVDIFLICFGCERIIGISRPRTMAFCGDVLCFVAIKIWR